MADIASIREAYKDRVIANNALMRSEHNPADAMTKIGHNSLESGCVTLKSFVLSISIMCKDLWKLLHDINTSVLTKWNDERISYKPHVITREIPRITHHV
jgi:hypothetical protein